MIPQEESVADKCRIIHEILESLTEYNYKTSRSELPKNGIYFFYEEGEFCTHGNEKQKRIVRVGINKIDENFRSRINSHYRSNKNSSVFRKHIGGALLKRLDTNDKRLEQWLKQDAPTFQEMETEVTKEFKGHFSFRCIPVDDKEERLQLEEEFIATIAKCDRCKPSENWLGNFASDELVRTSGLWNHQHVTSNNVLTGKSIERIRALASKNSTEARALFLIPCCSEKVPDGDNPPWMEVHSNQELNKFQFLDKVRLQMIDFYSNLKEDEGLKYYKRYDKNHEKKIEKRKKAWRKNLLIPECRTMKAIERYNGNLYSELSLNIKEQLQSNGFDNVLIVSALMGIISPADLIPDYELMMTDKSPNNKNLGKFWIDTFAIAEVKQPLQKIFSKFNHIYCLMSTTTGYVDSVATLLSDYSSYCIIPQESGQTNKLKSWGSVLNEVLLNNFHSPDQVKKVAEMYNCRMVELTNRKTPIHRTGHQKVGLPFNSDKVVPLQKPKELGGVKMANIKVADETWIGCALLHYENPTKESFSAQEIVSRVKKENIFGSLRPGIYHHAQSHCVANRRPQGGRYRMLYELSGNRRRLFRDGDDFHPDRAGPDRAGTKTKPDLSSIPEEYQYLLDWYDNEYNSSGEFSPKAVNAESERGPKKEELKPEVVGTIQGLKCPECGFINDQDSRFCEECGLQLNICPNCGNPVKPTSKFCGKCGITL